MIKQAQTLLGVSGSTVMLEIAFVHGGGKSSVNPHVSSSQDVFLIDGGLENFL